MKNFLSTLASFVLFLLAFGFIRSLLDFDNE